MTHISKYIFMLFVYTITILNANIDDDIRAIQNASVEERFKLMNAFKKHLIQMNEDERTKAITKLGKNANTKNAKKALAELKKAHKRKYIRQQIEQQQIETENIVGETEDFNGGDNDHE